MKNNKRALAMMTAAFMAITPLAATGMTAFATTITINKVAGDKATHNYKAFPLITGTLASDGTTLTAMEWNTAINREKLATALKTFDSETFKNFTATTTPADFADMIKGYTNNDGLAKVFNDDEILSKGAGTELSDEGDTFKFEVENQDGWYLVIDDSTAGNIKSANILRVIGDSEPITPKFSLPTLEKKITDADGTNPVDANTAAIGDDVYYKLSSNVPKLTGYDHYYFIVTDTLSPGLTFNPDSMKVKIGDLTINEDDKTINPSENQKYYIVTEAVGNGTQIKVVFENFLETVKEKNIAENTPVTITYNATLNENAEIDPAKGNPNTANLTYSNNPNYKGDGTPSETPDEPTPPEGNNPSDVVGKTPDDKVNTFTTAIKIKKVDENTQPLTGASFKLTGENLKNVKVASGSSFVADTAGDYYKLKDGSYTKTAPTEATSAKYDGTTKYKKVDTAGTFVEATEGTSVEATVDAQGYITFYGLKPGNYTLEETVVPDTYNKAPDETFEIAATALTEDAATWSISNNKFTFNNTEKVYEITIKNKKGNTLPSTGGIGTKLFYIFGGLLVAGSGVLLITKKRMAKDN